uniref:Uncharacterized protein n=1 Tax=Panagrolaimus superbus TaxID=310955 RepID=A0A914Y2J5_9BILA
MSNEKETILAITVKNNSTNVLKYLINSYNQMVETVNKNDFVSPELKNGSPENGEIIYKLLYETDINLNTLLHLIAKTGKIEIFEVIYMRHISRFTSSAL